MEIAKGVKSQQYLNLNLNDLNSKDWIIAFSYFEKRIYERFIEPIEILIQQEKETSASEKKYGFTILTICFLLIETLQSFYNGKTDSKNNSRNLFIQFLKERDSFKKEFSYDGIISPSDFYSKYRSGIIHQSQTFGKTKVWSLGDQLLFIHEGYVVLNRCLFYEKTKFEFEQYLKDLRSLKNIKLMLFFKKKMDFIAKSMDQK